jgi:hypothetical protein
MNETIGVITNDPENSKLQLRMFGKLEAYVTVAPRRVILKGKAGEPVAQTIRIIPETDEPLKITNVTAVRGVDFDYDIEEIELSGKTIYALRVENKRQEPGRYYDTINMTTDNDEFKKISVVVSGIIQAQEEGRQ